MDGRLTRHEVEDVLAKVAGPLGPFVSFDDYLSSLDEWIESSGPDLIEVLLAIGADPTWPARYSAYSAAALQHAVAHVLSIASARYPDAVPHVAGPLLDEPATRLLAIDALAAAGTQEGLPWLGRLLVSGTELDDEEMLHFAEAVADIGGGEGRRLLARMSSALPESPLLGRVRALLDETDRRSRRASSRGRKRNMAEHQDEQRDGDDEEPINDPFTRDVEAPRAAFESSPEPGGDPA